jgi:hypothetical protein
MLMRNATHTSITTLLDVALKIIIGSKLNLIVIHPKSNNDF